jgi:hypothetical protein
MHEGMRIRRFCEIIERYCSLFTLERALKEHFNQQLAQVAIGNNLAEISFRLVCAFEARLAELATAIGEVQPNPELREAFARLLEPLPGVRNPGRRVHETLLVSAEPPEAFIDRTSLRQYLVEASREHAGYHALSLHGSPASGKTFSWQLIQAVAQEQEARAVYLDVSEGYLQGDEGLQEVCEHLAMLLDLDGDSLRRQVLTDNARAEKVALKFALWLEPALRSLPRPVWLGLDGLNAATTCAGVTGFLIPHLLKRAAAQALPGLFLILFGYDARTIRQARGRILHEEVEGLTRADVEGYVRECVARSRREANDAETAALVQRIVKDAQWPYDHEAMLAISREAGRVAKEMLP